MCMARLIVSGLPVRTKPPVRRTLRVTQVEPYPARLDPKKAIVANSGRGLPEREGTFNMCTLWVVESLTRAGRADPARL